MQRLKLSKSVTYRLSPKSLNPRLLSQPKANSGERFLGLNKMNVVLHRPTTEKAKPKRLTPRSRTHVAIASEFDAQSINPYTLFVLCVTHAPIPFFVAERGTGF